MQYMKIGNSGIEASRISLGGLSMGGGAWWNGTDDAESIRTIHYALDHGINLIDTAPLYGFGHSEEIIGKALADRRDKAVVSTKFGMIWDKREGTYWSDKGGESIYINVSAPVIREEILRSLKRLNTDYIDIYYPHNPARAPFLTPVEETVEALMRLKQEGHIRAIGTSNAAPANVEEYLACGCEIDILQRKYNILEREFVETNLLPICRKHNMSFHAYSPLERGILTGKYRKDYQVDPLDARTKLLWWKPENYPLAIDFVDGLEDLCRKNQCTLTDLAVAFLLAQGSYINVICGAHKPEQIEDDIRAAGVSLSEEDVAEIRRRVEELEKQMRANQSKQ